MKTTNEHLVESFLKENKEAIKDNGFTQQVIYFLPKKKPSKIPLLIVSTALVVFAIVLILIINYTSFWITPLNNYMQTITSIIEPFFYLDYKTVIVFSSLLTLILGLDLFVDSK